MSYDEDYETFLKGMGIPFFVVPIIMGMTEKLTIEASNDPDGLWTMTTTNGTNHSIIYHNPVRRVGLVSLHSVWGPCLGRPDPESTFKASQNLSQWHENI